MLSHALFVGPRIPPGTMTPPVLRRSSPAPPQKVWTIVHRADPNEWTLIVLQNADNAAETRSFQVVNASITTEQRLWLQALGREGVDRDSHAARILYSRLGLPLDCFLGRDPPEWRIWSSESDQLTGATELANLDVKVRHVFIVTVY